MKHDKFVSSIFSFTTRRLCCKTCQNKISQVAFSTVERQNSCCLEPDSSRNGRSSSSTSGLTLPYISNLVQLNKFVASILFEQATKSPQEDLSDWPEEILESLSLKYGEHDASVSFGNNATDVVKENSTSADGNDFEFERGRLTASSARTSEVMCEKNLDKNTTWYKKLFGAGEIRKCVCGKVLPSITNKNHLGRSSDDEQTGATLPDVVRFLLPGLPLMCDFDQTRTILYELNFPFLLVQYFCDSWCCLVGKEYNAEVTVSLPFFRNWT